MVGVYMRLSGKGEESQLVLHARELFNAVKVARETAAATGWYRLPL